MSHSRYRSANYRLPFEHAFDLEVTGNWPTDHFHFFIHGYQGQDEAISEARESIQRDLISLASPDVSFNQLMFVWSNFGVRYEIDSPDWDCELEVEKAACDLIEIITQYDVDSTSPEGLDISFPLVREFDGTRDNPQFGRSARRKKGQPMIIGFDKSRDPLDDDCAVWVVNVFESLPEAMAVAQNLICNSMRDFHFNGASSEVLAGLWSKCGSGYLVLGGWVPTDEDIVELAESVVREMEGEPT